MANSYRMMKEGEERVPGNYQVKYLHKKDRWHIAYNNGPITRYELKAFEYRRPLKGKEKK